MIFDIVRDTPLIEIEAFSTNKLINFLGNEKSTIQDLLIILIFFTLEVVST